MTDDPAPTVAHRPPPLKVELVALDQLSTHPDNKRIGDRETIKLGLTTYDQYAPLVVQRDTRHIVIGNNRFLGMLELGWTHANVHWRDLTDDEARRLLAFDNRSSDKATYDQEGLVELLASMDTLAGTGYEDADLDELRRLTAATGTIDLGGNPPAPDPDQPRDGREYFQLNYPVTEDQRKIVLGAVKKYREGNGLETSVDALVGICQSYLNAQGDLDAA